MRNGEWDRWTSLPIVPDRGQRWRYGWPEISGTLAYGMCLSLISRVTFKRLA